MGIVIDGLEMPKENERLEIVINSNGKVTYSLDLDCKQIAIAHSPKVGHWVKDESGEVVCSECGTPDEVNPFGGFMGNNYCSECGADMREASDHE